MDKNISIFPNFREKIRKVKKRKKNLYFTCLISLLIIVTVIIVYFSCFHSKRDDEIRFDELNTECLKTHNYYRKLHGVPPIKLSAQLIITAKERAEYLVSNDEFEHPKYEFSFGENLHYITRLKTYPCNKVIKPWYDEIKDYNFGDLYKSKGKIGHFTQVVWKDTERLGCAQKYSKVSRRLYTVCNYDPPGNYIGQFSENVLPLTTTTL